MLADLPELAELDINPLLADAEGVIALDARVRVDAREPAPAPTRFAIPPYPGRAGRDGATGRAKPIVLRPIRPEDEAQHRAFVEQLAPEDLRLRFFSSAARAAAQRARPADADRLRPRDGVHRRSAPRRRQRARRSASCAPSPIPDNVEAEFAIIVRSDLKGRGLGQLLLGKMIGYLRAHGTQRMVGVRAAREPARCASWRCMPASKSMRAGPTPARCALSRP